MCDDVRPASRLECFPEFEKNPKADREFKVEKIIGTLENLKKMLFPDGSVQIVCQNHLSCLL